jgi:putative aldouronate transport system permease protein
MKQASLSDRTFGALNKGFVFVITLLVIYPVIFVISASISNPQAVSTGEMWLWPVDITLDGFRAVFQNPDIWLGYRNTIIYTVAGTLLHLFVLLPGAYALSRKELAGKKFFLWLILFTMFFNGGLIPTYLLIDSLGMVDTMWAVIVPNVVGAWSILVARTFFQSSIPDQLVEASKMDGASDFYIFLKVVIPLSLPLVAVMALFHAVSLWNQYFLALIYISDREMYPLQLFLREILIINEGSAEMGGAGVTESIVNQVETASLVKYAVIIVSALPLLIVYPFLQRYFVKGVLIGSVKE